MSESLAAEIGEIARLALELGRRRDVTPAERLAYHRRKAELLDRIAEQRGGDEEAREVAAEAWRKVRELEAAQ